jgi:hypothetical protein
MAHINQAVRIDGCEQLGDAGDATHDSIASLTTPSPSADTPTQELDSFDPTSSVPWSIAVATAACRRSLTKCLAIRSLEGDWAEDRLADFKLWDAGVGASTSRKASLEERLMSKPHLRTAVLNILLVLNTTIDRCRELGILIIIVVCESTFY